MFDFGIEEVGKQHSVANMRMQLSANAGAYPELADRLGVLTATPQVGAGADRLFVVPDYCVAPSHRILHTDMTWRPAGATVVGDEVVGFDQTLGKDARMRPATIVAAKDLRLPCYRIITQRRELIASADHLWVARRPRPGHPPHQRRWTRTDALEPGSRLSFFVDPWDVDLSRDGGYLAGFLDGEGYASERTAGFGQNDGPLAEHVVALLQARGFELGTVLNRAELSNGGTCRKYWFKGNRIGLRVVGMLRPLRLLPKVTKLWNGARTWGRLSDPDVVQAVEPIGVHDVRALQTSTGTFIVEGLLSHNCQLEYRLAAADSSDANMIDCCRAADPHRLMSERITNHPYSLEHNLGRFPRPQAKTSNFSQIYGAFWPRLQAKVYKDLGIWWPDEFAQIVWQETHAMYPRLYQRIEEVKGQTTRQGWIANVLGHRRDFPQVFTSNRTDREAALREAFNHVIQSLGHDLLSKSMDILLAIIHTRGLDWWLCNDNHDGFMLNTPASEARRAAWLCKRIMEFVPLSYLGPQGTVSAGWLKGVPIFAEVAIGTHYGNLRELAAHEFEEFRLAA
jgi:hypothetical protein